MPVVIPIALKCSWGLGLCGETAVFFCFLDGLYGLSAGSHAQCVINLLAIEVGELLHVEGFVQQSVALVDVPDLCIATAFQVSGDVDAVAQQRFLIIEKRLFSVLQIGVDSSYIVICLWQMTIGIVLFKVVSYSTNERVGSVFHFGFFIGFDTQQLVVCPAVFVRVFHFPVHPRQYALGTVGIGLHQVVDVSKNTLMLTRPVATGGQHEH